MRPTPSKLEDGNSQAGDLFVEIATWFILNGDSCESKIQLLVDLKDGKCISVNPVTKPNSLIYYTFVQGLKIHTLQVFQFLYISASFVAGPSIIPIKSLFQRSIPFFCHGIALKDSGNCSNDYSTVAGNFMARPWPFSPRSARCPHCNLLLKLEAIGTTLPSVGNTSSIL